MKGVTLLHVGHILILLKEYHKTFLCMRRGISYLGLLSFWPLETSFRLVSLQDVEKSTTSVSACLLLKCTIALAQYQKPEINVAFRGIVAVERTVQDI